MVVTDHVGSVHGLLGIAHEVPPDWREAESTGKRTVDLETLRKYSRGDLTPKQYLAVHRDAGELLEILQKRLCPGEYVAELSDWPSVRSRRHTRQYVVLKTMMLITPFVLVTGTAFALVSRTAVPLILTWLAFFALIAVFQLLRRTMGQKSASDRSVVAVTDRRLMRIWLDGSGEVQSWPLSPNKETAEVIEPVPETVRLLLDLDLGKTSLN